MLHLVIQDLAVSGVNILNGMFSVGYPAMTSFAGLAHAIMRSYAEMSGDSARLDSFAVIHHDGRARLYGPYKDQITCKRFVYAGYERPSRETSYYSPPIAEIMPQGDVRFSLILKADFNPVCVANMASRPGRMLMVPPRVLGGVSSHIEANKVSWVTDGVEAIQRTPPGWLVLDRTADLFKGVQGKDSLETLLDVMSEERKHLWRDFERRVPSQIGFRAISTGARREGCRDDEVDHYFAEPVIGLIKFARKFSALKEAGDTLAGIFWSSRINREAGLFTCSAATAGNEE